MWSRTLLSRQARAKTSQHGEITELSDGEPEAADSFLSSLMESWLGNEGDREGSKHDKARLKRG